MRPIAILILAVFLVSSIFVPASASQVTISVDAQHVHALYSLSLVQNITSLPSLTTNIDSASEPSVSAAFANALRAAYPPASASNFTLGVTTDGRNLNLTCTMDVVGVSQRNGDTLTANMTWLPFDVNSDLRVQNFSFNTVGSRYFKSVVAYYANASRFVSLPNSTITGVTFFVNGTSIGPPAAVNYAGNFTTLKFDSLNPYVGGWNRTFTLTNNTTTFRYFPSQLLSLDMRIQRKSVTTDYVARYGYVAAISVPGVGRAQGNVILVDVGTGEIEWAMAAIVVVAVLSAIGVQILFRKSKRRIAKFQKK